MASGADIAANTSIRVGLQLLNPFGAEDVASPGPWDEIAGVLLIGGGVIYHITQLPYGSVSSYPSQSQTVTSTTGHSQRGSVKKQIRSTSRSNSYRRRNYYYGKKRRYY